MRVRDIVYVLLLAVVSAVAGACAVARHVPKGESVLNKTTVEIDKTIPRDQRVSRKDLEGYVLQTPARRFIQLNLPVWVYNMADPEKTNGWNNFLRKLGNKPVVHDSLKTVISADNMELYLRSRGYFDAESFYSIEYKRRQKVNVKYGVRQGEPYRIGSIKYDFRDKFLEQVILSDNTGTLIREGDVLDLPRLDNERTRVAGILKNKGYYNFSVDNISFVADTLTDDHNVDLTVIVKQHISGIDAKGDPIEDNNAIYRIKQIYLFQDYDTAQAAHDTTRSGGLDTLYYNGLNIISQGKPNVRPATMRRAINLYPEYIYSYNDVQRVYNNIIRLGFFKSVSILFSEVECEEDNYVTIIDSDDGENVQHTAEKYLNCTIICIPGLLQSYSLDLEATTSSSFYGLKSALTYQNRNLFRGSEQFSIGISGGYEFLKARQLSDSYEIGVSSSLQVPRFLIPFPVDRANKVARPQTRVEFSINMQNRSKYRRTISGGRWGYSWALGRYKTISFRPLDVSIVKMGYIDQEFYDNIQNPYLQNSYESQMILGFSGSYVYSNNTYSLRGSSLLCRFNWETSGNLLYGISNAFGLRKNSSDQYTFLGVPYSQYVRMDISVSNNIPITTRDLCFVYRVYGGVAVSYGNSTAVPNTRLFYSGGANSMRGWAVRTLGQGNMPEISKNDYPAQMGNVKLELNAELRFPMWKALKGAVFFDLGNIWLLDNMASSSDEAGVFHFDSFYRQLGFNTGFGLRLDLNIAVLRLDWGVQLHNPNRAAGERWIKRFHYSDTALSFGIGYPF